MMIGHLSRLCPRAQPPAELDTGQAGQHPVQNNQVGRVFAEPDLGFIAARGGLNGILCGFKIVAQQKCHC
jgi:hypothetical protein